MKYVTTHTWPEVTSAPGQVARACERLLVANPHLVKIHVLRRGHDANDPDAEYVSQTLIKRSGEAVYIMGGQGARAEIRPAGLIAAPVKHEMLLWFNPNAQRWCPHPTNEVPQYGWTRAVTRQCVRSLEIMDRRHYAIKFMPKGTK